MSTQVVVGKLVEPEKIIASTDHVPQLPVSVSSWDRRAIWAWLRLQYGRKIDAEVMAAITDKEGKKLPKAERFKALKGFFDIKVLSVQNHRMREMQFIMKGKKVVAVASLKHLLIPPEQVYKTAAQIFAARGVRLDYPEHNLDGMVGYLKQTGGLKFGLQLYGGNILTRAAIKVASFVRVDLCTNPISWLGVGGFLGWVKHPDVWERVLRIKKTSELEPRLTHAISRAEWQLTQLESEIEHTKKVSVSSARAKVLVAAMGFSYGIGAKTVQQVLDRFEEEDQTQWGLSMALSWIAAHGEFRKAPKGRASHVNQKLSTISGATLLIRDMKAAEKKSLDWLKSHIVEGRDGLNTSKCPQTKYESMAQSSWSEPCQS